MGIVDVLSDLCSLPNYYGKTHKRKQFQTVEIKVKMDCEGCERRVKKALETMKGVNTVEVEAKKNKVTVTGYVEAGKVIRRVAYKTGKKVEPWPYVPYDLVANPYAPGAYDKKAPAGYVRNVAADPAAARLVRASSMEMRYRFAFSDDNPNACAVM
ncbi:heavy metal-associated isoprenylated plant protein 27-like [Typha angustifolia]|uniref:heavy metal-associated isoprenylated plant protein 27-like n=1 Tax=Typha angustifolia TaxID=59011 RepID=UPI003C2B2447